LPLLKGFVDLNELQLSLQVKCNVAQHNLALLIYHMRVLQALSANKNLSMERVVSLISIRQRNNFFLVA
jgi:hypothetical protein